MEQKHLEKRAEGPLSDDALDAVSGGLGSETCYVYCPYCRFDHKVKRPDRCVIIYEGKFIEANRYICGPDRLFYTAKDTASTKTIYFNSEMIAIEFR